MHRLRCLLVAAAVAVALGMVAAGPAEAAKGGNSDNAHACQQGGHESQFEAETGRAFNNAGDCTSHGALGGALGSLELKTDSCGTDCWGTLVASGLKPNGAWFVTDSNNDTVAQGTLDGTGSIHQQLGLPCGLKNVVAVAPTGSGLAQTNPINAPC